MGGGFDGAPPEEDVVSVCDENQFWGVVRPVYVCVRRRLPACVSMIISAVL